MLGDDKASQAFDRFARTLDKTNGSIERNNAALRKQKAAQDSVGTSLVNLTHTVTGSGDAFTVADRKASLFARAIGGIGLATGLAEPLVSSLVVAVGALSSAVVVAGAGLGAYGLAAAGLLKQVSALDKAQKQAANGTKASQQAYQKLLKDTAPEVVRFQRQLQGVTKDYKNWSDSLAKPVLSPLTKALGVVHPILAAIRPLVVATGSALGTLVTELSAKIHGGGVERIVATILPHVQPVILNLGHAIGNVIAGFWGILKAFMPFSDQVTGGLADLTKKFRDWATTLSGHSGFHAIVQQWRQDWPAIKPVLSNLLGVFKNIISDLAGMTTPANSKALWLIATPLSSLALTLSAHPALITTLTYLLLVGKGSKQIAGVFGAMKTGWGTFSSVLSKITGGKIGAGMQTAGDTMLLASRNMQKAADTMAGAGLKGGAGGVAGKAEGVAGKLPVLPLETMAAAGVAGGIAAASWIQRFREDAQKGSKSIISDIGRWFSGQGAGGGLGGFFAGAAKNLADMFTEHFHKQIDKGAGAVRHSIANWFTGADGAGAAKGTAAAWAGAAAEVEAANQRAGRSLHMLDGYFQGTRKTAGTAREAIGTYGTAVQNLGTTDTRTRAAREKLIYDMEQAGVAAGTAQREATRYTNAVVRHGLASDQARAARRRLIGDIQEAWKNSQQGREDMSKLTAAIKDHGVKSDAAQGARHRLITDLINAGLDADTARALVRKMIAAIADIKGKNVRIDVNGMGRFTIAQVESLSRPGGKLSIPKGAARGERIPGFGGGDRHLRLLEGGEAVVDKFTTARNAHVLRAWGVPGMQAGGVVDRFKGTPAGLGTWSGREVDKTTSMLVRATGQALEKGVAAAMRKAAQALFGGGGIVADAMRWLGRIPYVWGGTAVPGGADCSGFTQTIYGRHGIGIPRTAEQQGHWVRRTRTPVPGGLAFYFSPAGGGDPGHVAIIGYGGQVISQGGGMGPDLEPLHFMPLEWMGVPPGGFGAGGFGGAGGSLRESQLAGLWRNAGGPGWIAHLMSAIAMAESGGRANAVGPWTPFGQAKGLWQILGQIVPGNIFNPLINAENAVAKWRSQGLGAWEAYTNGAYRRFYGDGSWSVPGTGPAVVHKGEMILPEPLAEAVRQVLTGGTAAAAAGGRPATVALTQNGDVYIRDPVDARIRDQQLTAALNSAGF